MHKRESLVSAIIPTFNRLKELGELIDSLLYANSYRNIEVIIVDNDSKGIDYTPLLDKIKIAGLNFRLLINYDECTLSKSRNMGAKAALGDFLFFIDDDNIVTAETIPALLAAFESRIDAGIISPVAFYYDRRDRILDAGAMRNYLFSFTVNLFLNRERGTLSAGLIEVSEVSNAFMVRRDVIQKAGLFDELNFPIDLDEADLCIRAKRAGFKLFSLSGADIFHRVRKISTLSFTSLRFRRERNAYNMARNRIIFQRKHLNPFLYGIYLVLYFPLFYHLYILSQFLPHPGYNVRQRFAFIVRFMEGIKDGLFYDSKKLKEARAYA